jgi:hypothetical protein
MSPKIPSLAAGLTALGVSWSAMTCVAQAPSTPAPSAVPAPDSQDAPSPKLTVLLLSNGDVLQGEISEDDRGYAIKVKLGEFRRSRREVEAAFATLQDAYRYKQERIAAGDPDEHMSLAKWCLEQRLQAEAQSELKEVLKLEAGHPKAKSMLFLLEAQVERDREKKDPGVKQVGLKDDPAAPHELNVSHLKLKPAKRGPLGPPVILDLPPAQALRQYQEFVKYVHPELQRKCIKCHDGQSDGGFQLVPVQMRRDLTNEALLRANLDAVLRLVNASDLSHSELLESTLTPHPPTNRPLLRGPNDPTYLTFSTWVSRLKNSQTPGSPAPAGYPASLPPAPLPAGDGFATNRGVAPTSTAPPQPVAVQTAPTSAPVRPIGMVPDSKPGAALAGGEAADFRTVTPLLSPTNPSNAQVGAKVGARPTKRDASGVPATVVVGQDGKQKIVPLGPDGKPIPEAPSTPTRDRKAKPLKLDVDALNGFLNKPR